MATYPVEFHRRLEQKWESRIEQTLSPPIQSRWPGSRFDHGDTLFLCPSTGHRVQGWFADNGSEDDGEMYEGVVCLACRQVHMVNPRTGKALGADEEANWPTSHLPPARQN